MRTHSNTLDCRQVARLRQSHCLAQLLAAPDSKLALATSQRRLLAPRRQSRRGTVSGYAHVPTMPHLRSHEVPRVAIRLQYKDRKRRQVPNRSLVHPANRDKKESRRADLRTADLISLGVSFDTFAKVQ